MVFLVVMYGCVSSTIKKAECWRIDAFELCCWRKLLRVPWIARRSSQSILKEISPEYSLKGHWNCNILATWCNELSRKDPDAGKDWRREEKGMTEGKMVGWHHQLDGHKCEQALGVDDRQGSLVCCSPWGSQRVGHNWATELNLLYWPEIVISY